MARVRVKVEIASNFGRGWGSHRAIEDLIDEAHKTLHNNPSLLAQNVTLTTRPARYANTTTRLLTLTFEKGSL